MLRAADCGAIVTAAGASSRMGRLKALLDWGGRPLVAHQAQALRGFADVVVVVGCEAAAIEAGAALTAPARWVENAAWAQGRSTTIEAGARALAAGSAAFAAVLVVAVDQPLVPGVVAALLEAYDPERHDVATPVDGAGRRGHPILLGARWLAELARASERPMGLRDVVTAAREREVCVPVGDAPVRWDLNDEAAYRAALAAAFGA